MPNFQDLMGISNTLINDAKVALRELKRGNYQHVVELVNKLKVLDELQLKLILAGVQTSYDKPLFFDISEKAKEMYREILLAKDYLQRCEYNKTRNLLRMIIALEKTVIGKETLYREERILISKVTAEAAVMLFIRNMVDPYVQNLGYQSDVLNYKVTHIREYIQHEVGPVAKDVWERLKFWEKKAETKKEEKKQEFVTKEKILGEYKSLVSHPKYMPHLTWKEPWMYIYSDIFYIPFILTFGYVVITKNIPKYIKRKIEARRVKKVYSLLHSVLNQKVEAFRGQIRVLIEEAMRVNSKLREWELRLRKQEEESIPLFLRENRGEIEGLLERGELLIDQGTSAIEVSAERLAAEARQIVDTHTNE